MSNIYSFTPDSVRPNPPWMSRHFNLNPDNIAQCDKYFILYSQSRYAYIQLLAGPTIIREKIQYYPVFLSELSKEYLGANPEEQIKVSFRRLRGNHIGLVLISKLSRQPE